MKAEQTPTTPAAFGDAELSSVADSELIKLSAVIEVANATPEKIDEDFKKIDAPPVNDIDQEILSIELLDKLEIEDEKTKKL